MSLKCSGFFSIPMILLLVLIYFFRMELYMAGVQAATLISPNPALDKKLGDYYKDLSTKSTGLSQQYYDAARKDEMVVKERVKEDRTQEDRTQEEKPKEENSTSKQQNNSR